MAALITISAVLALLLVLLLSPAVLSFHYEDERLALKLRYLLFSVDLSPEALDKKAERKARRKPKAKKGPKPPKPEGKEKPKKKTAVTFGDIWALFKASRRAVNVIRWNLVFYRIRVTVAVGGPDAQTIGEKYAAYGIIIPRLIGLLDLVFTAVDPQVLVMPNFLREQSYWDVAFKARIAPWHVLAAVRHMLVQFLRMSYRNKQKREKIKGGKRHEPTASHK
jgi:hypothetical protein